MPKEIEDTINDDVNLPKPTINKVAHVRERWSNETNYIPFHYLPPDKFKKKLVKLLQKGGCNFEAYQQWVKAYDNKRKEQRKQRATKSRVNVLWEPILNEFDREINVCNSSLFYFRNRAQTVWAEGDPRKPAHPADYSAQIEANEYYRWVLRETRKQLMAGFVKQDISPLQAWERIGREGRPTWDGFVPAKRKDKVRAMFAALTRQRRGKQKLPFATKFIAGETSHPTFDGIDEIGPFTNQPNPEPTKGDQPKPFDINDPDNWN